MGRTTKFLPVIGAVVVAPNPGWSVCGWWWLSSIVPYSPRATIFQPFSGISPKSPLLMIIILGLKSARYNLYLPFPWLLMFKCKIPVAFYCLIARTSDRVNLLGTFWGKFLGKFGGFVGERVSYARCCGRRVPCCAARVVCCSLPTQTRAFFNQSRPDRRAGRMSVSMERTNGFLKANVEVPV